MTEKSESPIVNALHTAVLAVRFTRLLESLTHTLLQQQTQWRVYVISRGPPLRVLLKYEGQPWFMGIRWRGKEADLPEERFQFYTYEESRSDGSADYERAVNEFEFWANEAIKAERAAP